MFNTIFDTVMTMHALTRGQKAGLADLGLGNRFEIGIDVQRTSGSADISCFGLDAAGRLSDDRYMVFYNQLSSPGGAIVLRLQQGRASFQVDLAALPPSIAKLVFTAALDGAGTMRDVGQAVLRLGDSAHFALGGADFASEKAVILGELYRRDGGWRVGAVGQGFDGGMAALLKHFGGEEAPAAAARPTPMPTSMPTSAPAQNKPVSLSKITLEKRGDKVSLEKRRGAGFGRIHVNLNWNQQAPGAPRGFLARLRGAAGGAGGTDLDLGCLYELADGSAGVVQALGERFGSVEQRPWIGLDGDDRTGAVSGGENLHLNGDHFDRIRRVLVFAFIYQGVANWTQTDGVVTITLPDQPMIEVRLDNGTSQRMCAIAMIENTAGGLQVTKLAEYVAEHRALDQKYGFGLRWKAGSKD
jgi:tellurite resistance protein TerA